MPAQLLQGSSASGGSGQRPGEPHSRVSGCYPTTIHPFPCQETAFFDILEIP